MVESSRLKEGTTYILDKDFANAGEVILVKKYGVIFCQVEDPETGARWETMQYRLTDISNEKSNS